MSSIWLPNSEYAITVSGIRADDGEAGTATGELQESFQSFFYTPFQPLWTSELAVRMDLRGYIEEVQDYVLLFYIYNASLDVYRKIKASESGMRIPDPSKTIDELLESGYDESAAALIECYVRWRTQYDILSNEISRGAVVSGVNKALGDFRISFKADPSTVKEALEHNIEPRMNECLYELVGRFGTKARARIAVRGSTKKAAEATVEARRHMRPGFRGPRNWEWYVGRSVFRGPGGR